MFLVASKCTIENVPNEQNRTAVASVSIDVNNSKYQPELLISEKK